MRPSPVPAVRIAAFLAPMLTLTGCSFVFVEGPPPQHQQMPYFDCTSSRALPIADATLGGLVALGALSDTEGETSEDIATGVVAATALVASAVYGLVTTDRCQEAKAALAVRAQHTATVAPSPPGEPSRPPRSDAPPVVHPAVVDPLAQVPPPRADAPPQPMPVQVPRRPPGLVATSTLRKRSAAPTPHGPVYLMLSAGIGHQWNAPAPAGAFGAVVGAGLHADLEDAVVEIGGSYVSGGENRSRSLDVSVLLPLHSDRRRLLPWLGLTVQWMGTRWGGHRTSGLSLAPTVRQPLAWQGRLWVGFSWGVHLFTQTPYDRLVPSPPQPSRAHEPRLTLGVAF